MICYLDMDGVQCDFIKGVLEAFDVKGDPYLKEENYGNWWIQKILGIPDEEFYSRLDFNFWANLPKTKEADEIVSLVMENFKEVRVLTTSCLSWGSYGGKYEWISKHYPFLRRSIVTSAFKHELAKPDRLLIDDSDVNIEEFDAAGGMTFKYPRAWNSLYYSRNVGLQMLKELIDNV